jgi:hypothetical protein
VIAGAGPESGVLALRASALQPSGRVHFMGQVRIRCPHCGRERPGGAQPGEAFRTTILDALALGVPVVGPMLVESPGPLSRRGILRRMLSLWQADRDLSDEGTGILAPPGVAATFRPAGHGGADLGSLSFSDGAC